MSKRRKDRHKRKILTPIVIILAAISYGAWTSAQPLLTLKPRLSLAIPTQAASPVSLPWPEYGESAIGAAGYGVLASHGDQKPLPTASIAKVITALVVLRQRPLHPGQQGPTITLTQADVDSYREFVAKDGSVVGVALGEQISEYQALQALLLPSANNMAETLARWAFGSIDAFNAYANEYAKELGLTSVHMTDPSGYDNDTVASARDLTVMGNLAMLNPVFAEIVAQASATIPVEGTIYNYNAMLGKGDNVGIKTGNNDGDRGAFLFAVKKQVGNSNVIIVGTIMGGPDLPTVLRDSGPLGNAAAQNFKQTTFVRAGQIIGSYQTPDQGTVTAVAAQDVQFTTWNGHGFATTAHLNPLSGATKTSKAVGTITVTDTTNNISTTAPVVLSRPINTPNWRWRLLHPF